MPVVRLALVDLLDPLSPSYRTPRDGVGFTSWQPTRAAAAGAPPRANWAFERVGAPLAWGCTVGDTAIAIAVVDRAFSVNPDLYPNVRLPAPWISHGNAHGTKVASVIGAVGDNQNGMSGLVWNARLRLYDYGLVSPNTPTGYEVFTALQSAGYDGARVINLSSGYEWRRLHNRLPAASGRDSQVVRDIATVFREVLASWEIYSRPPLVVVAAANDGIDAFWSGLPQLSTDSTYRARVLSVAAAAPSGVLASFSNRNPSASAIALVELAAPGVSVAVLDGGGVTSDSGTSFAAPFVTGVAAMLLAVDSTMVAGDLKRLLIAGSQLELMQVVDSKGGSPLPLLDAYGALRLASTRLAAPLCGNRIWVANRQVHIQRGTAEEVIPITLPTDSVWNLEVAHGGRQINYETTSGEASILWTPNGWVSGTATPIASPDRGGANRSLRLQSHNGDSLLTVLVAPSTASVDIDVTLWGDAGLTSLRSTQINLPGLAAAPLPTWPENEWVYLAGAYPQNGGDALLAVTRMRATNTFWYSECPNGPSVTCSPGTPFAQYYWRPKQADLYRINVASAPMTATHVATIPDTVVYDIAFSEDGREKLLRIGRDSIYDDPQAGVYSAHSLLCQQTWSRPSFGSTSTTTPFDSSHARLAKPVFGCLADTRVWHRQGAGTSAPRVGPEKRTAPRVP